MNHTIFPIMAHCDVPGCYGHSSSIPNQYLARRHAERQCNEHMAQYCEANGIETTQGDDTQPFCNTG